MGCRGPLVRIQSPRPTHDRVSACLPGKPHLAPLNIISFCLISTRSRTSPWCRANADDCRSIHARGFRALAPGVSVVPNMHSTAAVRGGGWPGNIGVVSGGDRGSRTPNLGIANAALSQLSYIPTRTTASIISFGPWMCQKRRARQPGQIARPRARMVYSPRYVEGPRAPHPQSGNDIRKRGLCSSKCRTLAAHPPSR